MNGITKKITKDLIREFEPTGVSLRKEGISDIEIIKIFNEYKKTKTRQFYNTDWEYLKGVLWKTLERYKLKQSADSKAEMIFYSYLKKRGVPFKFQQKIGSYRVDYLIAGLVVFEGDGPHHSQQIEYDKDRDDYLKKQGYEVVRMRWTTIALNVDIVIDEIICILKEYGLAYEIKEPIDGIKYCEI